MAQTVAIVGSRNFSHKEPIERFVKTLPPDTRVISGGARGVDTWAEQAAIARGLETTIFQANWKALGAKAGPIRNAEIVRSSDKLAAFWDGKSRGTLNTVVQAHLSGLEISLFGPDGEAIPLSVAMEKADALGITDAVRLHRR